MYYYFLFNTALCLNSGLFAKGQKLLLAYNIKYNSVFKIEFSVK